MVKEEQTKRFDDAIDFHKAIDKKWGIESPNNSWPDFLIEYFNKQLEFLNKNS
mgnify:CR=1 FL=1